MLDYSDLTVYKNTDGIVTALGCPINSFMLQNNKPLFVGGGKKKNENIDEPDYENLAVPAGLVCMTQTICQRPDMEISENDIVPEGLYERLMELAETKPIKKMTKRNHSHIKKQKNKTHRKKNNLII
jgi:hypothetical protein